MKVVQKNFDIVIKLFNRLIDQYEDKLFDNDQIHENVTAYNSKNISFTNIPSNEIFNFLNKFSFHEEDYEMNTLREYIYTNSSIVNNWSVSLVRKNEKNHTKWDISRF